MAGSSAAKASGANSKTKSGEDLLLDRELEHLPPELRWREWMLRVEAVVFASSEPVSRETLGRVVGRNCSIDLLIDDLREELRTRPYDIVAVAGGWQLRTRPPYAEAIRASTAPTRSVAASLSEFEAMVLAAVAYLQPVTRGELSTMFGKEVSRDTIGSLRDAGFIASGPRSPTPGAPYTYVTTRHFLSAFGLETLRDLPDIEALEDAGFVASGPRSPTPGAPYTYVTTKHFLSAFGMETLRDLPDIERLEDAGLLSRQALEGDLSTRSERNSQTETQEF